MATALETLRPNMLTPAQYPNDARQDAAAFGASLTILAGQALGRKTSDNLLYPLNTAASDGTQTFVGFSMYDIQTDASKNVYYLNGGTAAANFRQLPFSTAAIWVSGIFDPQDLITSTAGAATAEVITVTPTNPTTGDIYTVEAPNGVAASFTVGATQTAAATVTGLKNSWNSDPYLTTLGTASGSGTFIVTAATGGRSMGLTASAVGTGTTALVVTTPAVAGRAGEKDTFTPANPTTADVYTLTLTLPDLTTKAISATVGATQTAAAISALLIAAWNADPVASAYATASGTSTVVLTAVNLGSSLSIAGSVVGTGTISKATTTAATGRAIADIIGGAPGARVLHNGFWQIPN